MPSGQPRRRLRSLISIHFFFYWMQSLLALSRFAARANALTIPAAAAAAAAASSTAATTSSTNRLMDSKLNRPIRTIMAPMVAASDYPFRLLCRQHGVDLCVTQMLHANNLVRSRAFQLSHFDFIPPQQPLSHCQRASIAGMEDYYQPTANQQHHEEGGPLMVQLAGHDPKIMLQAAKLTLEQAPEIMGIDVNLGCPQGIARKGRYGAFLMEDDEDLVMEILTTLRQSLPDSCKVSAKIRLPANGSDDVLEKRLHKLIHTGIDFVTIHGRTLHENKQTVGPAHWDKLRLAVQICGSKLPVVANGGIEQYEHVQQVLDYTGACAVMSSEALLENPSIFLPPKTMPILQQQVQFARDYLYLAAQYPPLPGTTGASMNIVRGHVFKFLHRFLIPTFRDELIKVRSIKETLQVVQDLEDYFMQQEEVTTPSWYRRYWAAREQQEELLQQQLPPITLSERKLAIQAKLKRTAVAAA